ncbi:MAG: hypothetical protein A3H61_01905 [Candidatus Jacksonbacteria bacterium RIFCSPLOWO2_02_FULL_44_20]|uniref:HEPN domain-containing protein n=1 Tax=Candidatus Jacksonbacteria bacterium RIFCSPLOWO2_02_FULL_44_20 TaxID=1798460 RepID=A0A1G2A806_9BACT|nr:MAG: hypothetical protein A3C00_04765 [Candidatus Jacksonbacteria bacterium RIFCSPHIGHO2_02_FULL_44_25]OGY73033.1 MAG: hypothetical protein A3H61_01905 [Candidatus Jacksonbacteria bacterium RIFCSPLOWO2_02_FULL_44_20]OGY74313.1 MAG: hypothetical protein A3H07_00980 [Candidatus Jacksonbacteria bacterium RIFCSPLOWO2_12_FULL_44_15b]
MNLQEYKLLSEGYFAKTHDGVITLFSLKFIKTHKIDARYVRIFKEAERDRIDADYRFLEEFTKQDAESVHKKAEEFVKMADKFLSVKLKGRKRNSIDIRGMLW